MDIHAVGGPALSRRDVILLGAGAVGASLLLGGDRAHVVHGLERFVQQLGRVVSLGFVEGSATLADPRAALVDGATVLPATTLSATPLSTASVTLHGFVGPAPSVAVDVDLLVDHPVDPTVLPVYAFTHRPAPAASTSSASRLRVEARGTPYPFGVRMVVDGTTTATVLSGRSGDGLPTFSTGLYLLGLDEGMWDRRTAVPSLDDPAWSGLPSVLMAIRDDAGR